jgi:hypothetical protein
MAVFCRNLLQRKQIERKKTGQKEKRFTHLASLTMADKMIIGFAISSVYPARSVYFI